jgi:allantoin racemase
MAEMCGEISAELDVPVVDGVSAATLTVQSLVTMGLRTSKRGEYATPPVKCYLPGVPPAG